MVKQGRPKKYASGGFASEADAKSATMKECAAWRAKRFEKEHPTSMVRLDLKVRRIQPSDKAKRAMRTALTRVQAAVRMIEKDTPRLEDMGVFARAFFESAQPLLRLRGKGRDSGHGFGVSDLGVRDLAVYVDTYDDAAVCALRLSNVELAKLAILAGHWPYRWRHKLPGQIVAEMATQVKARRKSR